MIALCRVDGFLSSFVCILCIRDVCFFSFSFSFWFGLVFGLLGFLFLNTRISAHCHLVKVDSIFCSMDFVTHMHALHSYIGRLLVRVSEYTYTGVSSKAKKSFVACMK